MTNSLVTTTNYLQPTHAWVARTISFFACGGAFRFLARHSGASAEVQMKTSEAGWWDGRELCGLKDSYRTLIRIFRFVCLSYESYGETKNDGWIPSSDFGFFCACITCKHAIF